MTASNSTSNKKRSVINFEKARLILVDKTLSYVELNSPDDFATRVNTVSRLNREHQWHFCCGFSSQIIHGFRNRIIKKSVDYRTKVNGVTQVKTSKKHLGMNFSSFMKKGRQNEVFLGMPMDYSIVKNSNADLTIEN